MPSLVKSGSVFMKLLVKKQLEEKLSDPKFCKALEYKYSWSKSSPDSTDYIYDGALYKSIYALNGTDLMNLSLSRNEEGVPILKSFPFHICP
jgi:hypothetical protein